MIKYSDVIENRGHNTDFTYFKTNIKSTPSTKPETIQSAKKMLKSALKSYLTGHALFCSTFSQKEDFNGELESKVEKSFDLHLMNYSAARAENNENTTSLIYENTSMPFTALFWRPS
ncbi:hypothetical protein AVEN_11752-1 [Araneus ventricosus]|uniref:Uncharacterized protein n=1 Tax=Araneus ventricosus TaxID=182803 RepID=A0A4Y2EQS7_ARAVE|nr:hypothetical protein AVEN_11752-1 [Araneus ventricosus]